MNDLATRSPGSRLTVPTSQPLFIPAPNNRTLLFYKAAETADLPTISIGEVEDKENQPIPVISPCWVESRTSLPYLAPSNKVRLFGDYKIFNDVSIGNNIVDIGININIINPYGGYLSGIVEYERETPSIRFYERFPHFCFCIRLRKRPNSEIPPRRIPSWISTHKTRQYNNVAKLIRDVLPELFGKPLRLHSRIIESHDYYVESDRYESGVP